MKKIILLILMLAIVVSCAVTGVAFAGSSVNRDYDVVYTSEFTGEATTENPGYLVFDKPLNATDGKTITMTMDIQTGTDLKGRFYFGLAVLSSPDANPMTSANSIVFYNHSFTNTTAVPNRGIAAGNGFSGTNTPEVAKGSGLSYKPKDYITEGNTIKVEYVAPTMTGEVGSEVETKGSIALYVKATGSDDEWTLVSEYTDISYSTMPQADNLYIGVMGWWASGPAARAFMFSNPNATDGVNTSTILNARGNMSYAPYSNFVDVPDDATASYLINWGLDDRNDQGYSEYEADYPNFVNTGVGNVAQGYFGNKNPASLAKDEALVMEFNVNNYGMTSGANFGFGVMSPGAAVADPYGLDDFYRSDNLKADGSSIYVYGNQDTGALNVTGHNKTITNGFPGNITYKSGESTMTYSYKPESFMNKDMSVKLVYTPYTNDLNMDGTPDGMSDIRLGSLIMYSKAVSAPDSEYRIAWAVTELGSHAYADNLYIVMNVNMATSVQSITISNYTITTRKIVAPAVGTDEYSEYMNGCDIQTADVVDKMDKEGHCTRRAVKAGLGIYVYYVKMTELVPEITEDKGSGVALYADGYDTVTDAYAQNSYAAIYYSHGNEVNDKLSTLANITFDVTANDGLKLLLNSTKAIDGATKISVPVLVTVKEDPVVEGAVTTTVTKKPTGTYTLKFEEEGSKTYAVLYAHYNKTTKTVTVQEGLDDLVTEETVAVTEKIESTRTEIALSEYYFGFAIEAEGTDTKLAVVDNFCVVDDPAIIGVNELDYVCTFDMGIPPSKFEAVTLGGSSEVALTDRSHNVAVTNGSIVGEDVYSMLVSDGEKLVILADEAPKGYRFDRWESSDGKVYSRRPEVAINASQNVIVTAKYELLEFNIVIKSGGKITFYEGDVISVDKMENVKYGDSIKLTADETDKVGWVFDGWYNGSDLVSADKEFMFEADESYENLTAVYKPAVITIQVINGSIKAVNATEASTSIAMDVGTPVIAMKDTNVKVEGMVFSHWELNGKTVSTSGSYAFNLQESGTLVGIYAKEPFSVKVTNGYIDGNTDVTEKVIRYGETVTLTAKEAPEGKTFIGWYSGEEKVSDSAEYAVTVKSDIDVEARYSGGGCAGFIAPPTSNGGGNNSVWLVAGMLVLCAVAVAIAKRNRTAKESK